MCHFEVCKKSKESNDSLLLGEEVSLIGQQGGQFTTYGKKEFGKSGDICKMTVFGGLTISGPGETSEAATGQLQCTRLSKGTGHHGIITIFGHLLVAQYHADASSFNHATWLFYSQSLSETVEVWRGKDMSSEWLRPVGSHPSNL